MASIKKIERKTGTAYQITVTQGADSTGKQKRHYMTWRPDHPMTAKQEMKEAQRIAIDFERQIEQGYRADDKQTFSEYAEYVFSLKESSGKVTPGTLAEYRKAMTRISPAIGYMKMADIRPQHLTEFYKKLAKPGEKHSTGRAVPKVDFNAIIAERGMSKIEFAEACGVCDRSIRNMCHGKQCMIPLADTVARYLGRPTTSLFEILENKEPLSAAVIQRIHSTISTVFDQAEKEMIVQYNPAKKATFPARPKKEAPNYFQPEQIVKILEAAEEEPLMWRTMLYVFITSGCRRGEILALKWDKVDFENGRIYVDKSLSYLPDIGIYEGDTKTGTARYVSLPGETLDLLKQWKVLYERHRDACGEAWENSGYVFVTKTGGPLRTTGVNSWLQHFAERHNLPHINPHSLRHSFASIAIAEGTDIVTVSRTLGHAKPSMTLNVYSHIIEDVQRKAVESVANAVLRNKKE